MRRILVTGANKGIGFAIVKGILAEAEDTFVFLGARDPGRGASAVRALTAADPSSEARVRSVTLDVANDASVSAAREYVREALAPNEKLYAIVNNAGLGSQAGSLEEILNVNAFGIRRTCEAFLPLLDPHGGRIVNVTSAAGPMFVEQCRDDWRRFFVDGSTDWEALEALMNECVALGNDASAFRERGLGDGDAYGLSKACANAYTLDLARRYPRLAVNACTPGFIETDMTRGYADAQGSTPADLGMKTPEEGARCPLFLTFGAVYETGRYYGSDCQRSPLDRYRAPGSPPYVWD